MPRSIRNVISFATLTLLQQKVTIRQSFIINQ